MSLLGRGPVVRVGQREVVRSAIVVEHALRLEGCKGDRIII